MASSAGSTGNMTTRSSVVAGTASSSLAEPSSATCQPDNKTSTVLPARTSAIATPELNSSASGVHADDTRLEHRAPGTYDPWFEKHGVKGFLSWDLLREDMPADRYMLGSSFPTLPQLSPRSEARSMAKIRELLANPPKNAKSSAQSRVRNNDRVSIFETRGERDARLKRLAQHEEPVREGRKSVAVDSPEGTIQREKPATKGQVRLVAPTTPDSDEPDKGSAADRKRGGVGPDFVIRAEKQPLIIREPEARDSLSSATVTHPIRELPNAAVGSTQPIAHHDSNRAPQPSTSAANARQLDNKPNQGRHRRQLSSLSAAAPPFRSQGIMGPLAQPQPQPSAPYTGHSHQPEQDLRGVLGSATPPPRDRGINRTVHQPRSRPPPPPQQPMGSFSAATRAPRPFIPGAASASAGRGRRCRRGSGMPSSQHQMHAPPPLGQRPQSYGGWRGHGHGQDRNQGLVPVQGLASRGLNKWGRPLDVNQLRRYREDQARLAALTRGEGKNGDGVGG